MIEIIIPDDQYCEEDDVIEMKKAIVQDVARMKVIQESSLTGVAREVIIDIKEKGNLFEEDVKKMEEKIEKIFNDNYLATLEYLRLASVRERMVQLLPEFYYMNDIAREDNPFEFTIQPGRVEYMGSNPEERPDGEGRNTPAREAIAAFLAYSYKEGTILDFGAGVDRRYCDLMKATYHIERNCGSCECGEKKSGYHCSAIVLPVIPPVEYDIVCAINSLQSNGPAEIMSLLRLWRGKRLVVVWPEKLGSDEFDPYPFIIQYFRIGEYGNMYDLLKLEGAKAMRYFISCDENEHPSDLFYDADNNCRSVVIEPDRSVAVHVMGLYNGKVVGSRFFDKHRKMWNFDFLAGGKVQRGEFVEQAIYRELGEELAKITEKLVWLGHAPLSHARSLVHYYYVELNSIPETKEERGPIRVIGESDMVRDNMIQAISYLERIGKVTREFQQAIEYTWLVSYARGLARTRVLPMVQARSMRSTPVHRYIMEKRNDCQDQIVENTYHYNSPFPLKYGEVIGLPHAYMGGTSDVYYKGRLQARIEVSSSFLARVVWCQRVEDSDAPVAYEQGMYHTGAFTYYSGIIGRKLFESLHSELEKEDIDVALEFLGYRERPMEGKVQRIVVSGDKDNRQVISYGGKPIDWPSWDAEDPPVFTREFRKVIREQRERQRRLVENYNRGIEWRVNNL